MQQWYQCPRCGAPVAFGVKFCGNCRTQLNWPTQQQQPPQYQTPQQPPPQYQQQYQQPPQYQRPQQQSEPPKKKKTNVWLIGCLGLIVLAAIIGGIILVTGTSSPETSPSTLPPTTITAAEQAYALAVVDQSTTMSTALTELVDLLQDYRLGDDEWTINVATQLATIRIVYDEAMALEPPNSMVDIHYKYVQGLKHYHTMTDLLARGIDELDVSLIEQAATEMNTGTDYITEATNLVNDFTESKLK
jgi:flagellar basal body-associated protein FliL